jgi:hypothetical protein
MSADEWSAIAQWALVLVAVVAAGFARGQVTESKRLREEQVQPYVAVFARVARIGIADVVIKNYGQTAARNVRVAFDPPLKRVAFANTPSMQEEIAELKFPTLAPGQEWSTVWDTAMARLDHQDLPERHDVRIDFSDARGRPVTSYESALDWNTLSGDVLDTHGLHEVVLRLKEIVSALEELRR